jgi:hypothetical protein
MVTSILTILAPLFQWFIQGLIKRFQLTDEQRKRLVEIDDILDQIDSGEIKRGKQLESKIPEMDAEMDKIESGGQKWPHDREKDEPKQ